MPIPGRSTTGSRLSITGASHFCLSRYIAQANLKHTDGGGTAKCSSFRRLMSPDGSPSRSGPIRLSPARAFVTTSSTDDRWKLAGECSRWTEEPQEHATRIAFRQMARVWAQLACGQHFRLLIRRWCSTGESLARRHGSPASLRNKSWGRLGLSTGLVVPFRTECSNSLVRSDRVRASSSTAFLARKRNTSGSAAIPELFH